MWKAGKLAETAEVSPDKIHWETVKEFLEGKLADSVDLQQEDEEPEESEEEVVKPKRSKIKVESGSGVTSDINYINKLLNSGEIIKGFMGNFIITASLIFGVLVLIFGVLVLIGIVGGSFRSMFNIGESPLKSPSRIDENCHSFSNNFYDLSCLYYHRYRIQWWLVNKKHEK